MNIKRESAIIRQLLYLLATIRNGKITQTAEENGIKASNLSNLLKDLEEATGVALLNRKSDGVSPTVAGKELYKLAKEFENTLNKFRNIRDKIQNDKRVIVYLPPNFEINLECFDGRQNVVMSDELEECDVAIMQNPPSRTDWEKTRIIVQKGNIILNFWIICKQVQNKQAYEVYRFLVDSMM